MASIPFTLAALATSAVPGLAVIGAREHEDDDAYVSAVVADENGEYLVRVPRTQAAEVQQSAELLGLAALTEGSRSFLPFAVPESLGMTRAGDTRAVVTTLIEGGRFTTPELADDALLLEPIAQTLAAIHNLPRTIAQQGGLPARSAQDLRLQATRLIDRAEATRLLPQTVVSRWHQIVEKGDFWDFAPTMVHGTLDAEQLRVVDDQISGVVGWSEFSVGDPASDFAWLLAAGSEVLDVVLARYSKIRNAGSVAQLRKRSALYYELEIARWLLHGVESRDESIVDDAVKMLDRLVDGYGVLSSSADLAPAVSPMGEQEVSEMLDATPEVIDHLSDTAAYEALDEDRMFGVDTDFIEPLDPDRDDQSASNGGESSTGDSDTDNNGTGENSTGENSTGEDSAFENRSALNDAEGETDHAVKDSAEIEDSDEVETENNSAGEGSRVTPDEQLTQPISEDDLPQAPPRLRQ